MSLNLFSSDQRENLDYPESADLDNSLRDEENEENEENHPKNAIPAPTQPKSTFPPPPDKKLILRVTSTASSQVDARYFDTTVADKTIADRTVVDKTIADKTVVDKAVLERPVTVHFHDKEPSTFPIIPTTTWRTHTITKTANFDDPYIFKTLPNRAKLQKMTNEISRNFPYKEKLQEAKSVKPVTYSSKRDSAKIHTVGKSVRRQLYELRTEHICTTPERSKDVYIMSGGNTMKKVWVNTAH